MMNVSIIVISMTVLLAGQIDAWTTSNENSSSSVLSSGHPTIVITPDMTSSSAFSSDIATRKQSEIVFNETSAAAKMSAAAMTSSTSDTAVEFNGFNSNRSSIQMFPSQLTHDMTSATVADELVSSVAGSINSSDDQSLTAVRPDIKSPRTSTNTVRHEQTEVFFVMTSTAAKITVETTRSSTYDTEMQSTGNDSSSSSTVHPSYVTKYATSPPQVTSSLATKTNAYTSDPPANESRSPSRTVDVTTRASYDVTAATSGLPSDDVSQNMFTSLTETTLQTSRIISLTTDVQSTNSSSGAMPSEFFTYEDSTTAISSARWPLRVAVIVGSIAAGCVLILICIVVAVVFACKVKTRRRTFNETRVRYRDSEVRIDIRQGSSARSKRNKKRPPSSPDGSDFDGLYLTAHRSAPPPSALAISGTENIFKGSFPVLDNSRTDLNASNKSIPTSNNLYEKDSDQESANGYSVSTFCARNNAYKDQT